MTISLTPKHKEVKNEQSFLKMKTYLGQCCLCVMKCCMAVNLVPTGMPLLWLLNNVAMHVMECIALCAWFFLFVYFISLCMHSCTEPTLHGLISFWNKWPQLGMQWTFQKLGLCPKKSEVTRSFLLSFSSSVPGHSLLTKTRIFFVTVLSELTII